MPPPWESCVAWYYLQMSNAQQSCVPATAPRTHVIKQQSDGDAMKKICEKWIKNQSKINQKWTKNQSKIARNGGLEASWRRLGGVLGRLGSVLGCLGKFRAVLGPSWSVLGPLRASCGRLGSVLEVSCVWFSGQSALNLGMLSWMSFCNWFLMDFASKNRCPNYATSLNSIGFFFLLSGCFTIILFLDVI